jgi:cytochrome c oxidase subunit I
VVFGGSIFGDLRRHLLLVPEDVRRMMNERSANLHFWPTFVFFNLTFFPMHIIGVGGQMRRIYNPLQYEFLQAPAALERDHHRRRPRARASQIPSS